MLLGAGRNGKEVYFLVEDDGPGVAEEERSGSSSRGCAARPPAGERTPLAGAGLGLSLARRLARAASGDVEVEPGQRGARFMVRLPGG